MRVCVNKHQFTCSTSASRSGCSTNTPTVGRCSWCRPDCCCWSHRCSSIRLLYRRRHDTSTGFWRGICRGWRTAAARRSLTLDKGRPLRVPATRRCCLRRCPRHRRTTTKTVSTMTACGTRRSTISDRSSWARWTTTNPTLLPASPSGLASSLWPTSGPRWLALPTVAVTAIWVRTRDRPRRPSMRRPTKPIARWPPWRKSDQRQKISYSTRYNYIVSSPCSELTWDVSQEVRSQPIFIKTLVFRMS